MDSGSGLGAARLGDDVGDGVLERSIREEGTVELNIRSPVSSVEDLRYLAVLTDRGVYRHFSRRGEGGLAYVEGWIENTLWGLTQF